jgi:drug/metabolite transporter (DMT)-like permease
MKPYINWFLLALIILSLLILAGVLSSNIWTVSNTVNQDLGKDLFPSTLLAFGICAIMAIGIVSIIVMVWRKRKDKRLRL